MKKFLLDSYYTFKFDIRTTGYIFFLPLFMWIISVLLLILESKEESQVQNIIIAFQGIYIPLSSWGLMYRLKEMYEDGAQDTLIPYYVHKLSFDIIRYLLLHLFGTTLWCTIFAIKYPLALIWPINILHFILLSIFFMFLGTGLIITIRNIEFSLTFLFIYIVLEVATLGEYMPWPHVFLFNSAIWDMQLIIKLVFILVYIVILILLTFIFIKREKNTHSFN